MPTRLDEQTTRLRELLETPEIPHPLVHVGTTSLEPRPVPARALVPAMLGWMAAVFALCYVGLPLLFAGLGWYGGVATGILFNLPSFLLATFVAVVTAAVYSPSIQTNLRAARDPVWSAAAGGLVTWAIIHNVSPILKHFDQFATLDLLSFVFMNVVEMTMIGMMLASFTRNKAVAFGLGAGFQLLMLGTVLGLFAV